MAGDRVELFGEKMVGAGDLAEIDLDVALVRQLVTSFCTDSTGTTRVLVALDDQAR